MNRLTTFVLGAFIGLWGFSTSYAQEIFEEASGLFSTRQLQAAAPIGKQKKVMIQSVNTLRGEIVIKADAVDEVSVTYFKKSKAASKSKAIDYIDLIAVRLEPVAEGLRLHLSAPNPAPWSGQEAGLVEAVVIVPESCVIEIEAQYFDITAEGPFEGMIVPLSLGNLEIADVTKQLKLKTANGRVSIERISGDISVATSNAELEAKDITSLGRQAEFTNDGGDIHIDGFTGEMSVKNSYGRIEITDFEVDGSSNLIRGFSGPIVVDIRRITDGQVVINNRFEDIEIALPNNLSARLSLAVDDNGKIQVSDIPFRTDLVEPNRLNLVTGEGEALISASVRGAGNISIRSGSERD
jgi:flagellar motor protein MotB